MEILPPLRAEPVAPLPPELTRPSGERTEVLHRLLFPSVAIGAPEKMYFRVADGAWISLSEARLHFKEGSTARSDTYFNALSIKAWKGRCQIAEMRCTLCGSGRFVLRFGLHRCGHQPRWLHEDRLALETGQPVTLELPFWAQLEDGLLFFELQALGEAVFTGGHYHTAAPPRRKVRLGIVITHFNRQAQVIPAVRRIAGEVLSHPHYRDRVSLVVVDNSRNLAPEEVPGALLLPNPNYGGSGGFARGLLHLKESGSHTHCLFMDDDASCETESIRRTLALLEHAVPPRFAVAGALLREIEPYRTHEIGAQFDGVWRPLHSGLDLQEVEALVSAEVLQRRPNYGGWWFFAFGIADVRHFPFPFFVRGDDVLFGQQNPFDICTLNGVACWAEDFAYKDSPMNRYLDMRAQLVLWLTHTRRSRLKIVRLLWRWFSKSAFSLNYASARAVTMAIRHVAQGPDFWRGHLDLSDIRAEIAAFSAEERMRPITRADLDELRHPRRDLDADREPALRKAWRKLTLNGVLLPSRLMKKASLLQPKDFGADLAQSFRFRRILYEHPPSGTGYIAVHDKRRFFRELRGFLAAMAVAAPRLGALRRQYRAALPALTSETFWRETYGLAVPDGRAQEPPAGEPARQGRRP